MSRTPIYTMMIEWDRLLNFFRSACSMPDLNDETGRDGTATALAVLRQEDLVEEYARRLYEIDARYKAQLLPLKEQLRKLDATHRAEEQSLAGELRAAMREVRLFEQWLGRPSASRVSQTPEHSQTAPELRF